MGHEHHAAGADWTTFQVVAAALLVAAAAAYGFGLVGNRGRSPWPAHRTALWYLGLACAGAGVLGPVADAAHSSFSAHMLGHLLLGMTAPLLLVLAAPVTLALRALPVPAARALSRTLRTPWVRLISHPVVAAVLNAGGLWLLYTTELYQAMNSSALIHALVHTHIFLAGYVFTASVVGVDPHPHRTSMTLRSVVLVGFVAAHSILAKWLYAHPPTGVDAADARLGAQLMYYGGDVVDVLLIVLLFARWYAATGPRSPSPGPHDRSGVAGGFVRRSL